MSGEINVDKLIIDKANEVLETDNIVTLDDFFIGPESCIESIDIVQIISLIEDELEKKGFDGIDIFDKVFDNESLKFKDLSYIVEKILTLSK